MIKIERSGNKWVISNGRLVELAFIGGVVLVLVLLVLRAIPMMDPDKDPAMQIVTGLE